MHEGLDHADFLLVAFGEIFDLPGEVQLEVVSDFFDEFPVAGVAAQAVEQLEGLACGQSVVEAELARKVAGSFSDGDGVMLRVDTEDTDVTS